MTGPEHFREAEQLLAGDDVPADNELGIGAHHIPPSQMDLLAAHVHATLAQVALTALSMPLEGQDDSPSLSQEDYDEWLVAIELEGQQGTEQLTCSQCPREVRPGRTYCSTLCRNADDRHDDAPEADSEVDA
jgi:hypothetical protein